MTFKMSNKNKRLSIYTIWIIIISVIWIQFNHKHWRNFKSVIQWDVVNYYQYLPATFDYGDLSLKFIDKDQSLLKWKFWPYVSPIGKYSDKMTMGLSFMYLPFYLIGQIQAYITNEPTDGFSSPYSFWLLFSSLFYVIIGFYYLRKVLLKYFSDGIVSLTIASIFFGTNLLYYTTLNAPMPHSYLFSLFSIFIYYTIKWHEKINIKNSIIIGILLGLISLIRPSSTIIIIFFIFYSITTRASLINKTKLFLNKRKYLMIIGIISFIIWIPQLIYWKYTTGDYFFFSYQNERFFFNNPQIIKGLFGFRKGWFIYTPLMFFAVTSIFLLLKKQKEFFLPIIIFTILNIYIILSWWCWWYGGTFGHRAFVESYAILSIPFALLLSYGIKQNRFTRITTIALVFILIIHQIYQTIQLNYKAIHYDSMSKEAYMDSFLRILPSSKFESLLSYPDYESSVIDNNYDTKPTIISIKTVNIKGSNGKYVCTDLGNNNLLFANKDHTLSWESFNLIMLNNGKCALVSCEYKYITNETEGKNEITGNRTEMKPWETFALHQIDQKHFAFKATNGKYLTIDLKTGQLFATAKTIGKKEIFEILYINSPNNTETNNIEITKRELLKTDFIYLDGKTFKHKGKDFFSIMLNYAVCIRNIENEYFVSCIKEYENSNKFEGNTKNNWEKQIRGHMQLMKEMGFNTIRLVFNRVHSDNSKYYYSTNGKNLYLEKDYDIIINALEKFINIVSDYDIKVMLLIKEPVENKEIEYFTVRILERFKNNSSIFAYDFFNEPLYFDSEQLPSDKRPRKKEDAYRIVSNWKKLMTEHAPKQLLTIGFSEPIEVFEWDPEILPVDFIAFHTYNPLRVANEIYWYGKYTSKPWMIGETALPADGDSISYDEQKQFMKEVYRRIVDCGGNGIGWWEFQEPAEGTFEAKYAGILNHKGTTTTKDGKYTIQGSVKPVVKEIAKFKEYKSKSTCSRLSNYYNMMGYNNFVITGKILNSLDDKPIEGAVIRGWNQNWSVGMNTFTNENGEFTLYSNDICVHFEISAPKMTKIKFDHKTNYFPVSNKGFNINSLPNRNLEYQKISYKHFLLHNYSLYRQAETDFYIFNFDPTKFNQAKFIGYMGIKKLQTLPF